MKSVIARLEEYKDDEDTPWDMDTIRKGLKKYVTAQEAGERQMNLNQYCIQTTCRTRRCCRMKTEDRTIHDLLQGHSIPRQDHDHVYIIRRIIGVMNVRCTLM